MSSSLSYLTSLYSSSTSTSDTSSSLLNTIYGISTGSSSSSGQNAIQALQSAEKNQTQDIKVTAAEPQVQRAIATFTAAVKSAKSVTQLLANPAAMNVILTANGMSDQIGYTALATKALTSNLSDPTSLANTLADTRWKTLASTYDFNTNGLKAIQSPSVLATIANAYATTTWQQSQDTITPGLSNALAFKAQASSLTSVLAILGNSTARTVVTTALGIPQQIAFQPLEAQEKAISTQLDVSKLQNPKFVETLVQQYLIANQAATSSTSSTTDLTTLAVSAQGILA
jgi:hypothetical protein